MVLEEGARVAATGRETALLSHFFTGESAGMPQGLVRFVGI
jgi:hypothetical protein